MTLQQNGKEFLPLLLGVLTLPWETQKPVCHSVHNYGIINFKNRDKSTLSGNIL